MRLIKIPIRPVDYGPGGQGFLKLRCEASGVGEDLRVLHCDHCGRGEHLPDLDGPFVETSLAWA